MDSSDDDFELFEGLWGVIKAFLILFLALFLLALGLGKPLAEYAGIILQILARLGETEGEELRKIANREADKERGELFFELVIDLLTDDGKIEVRIEETKEQEIRFYRLAPGGPPRRSGISGWINGLTEQLIPIPSPTPA